MDFGGWVGGVEFRGDVWEMFSFIKGRGIMVVDIKSVVRGMERGDLF